MLNVFKINKFFEEHEFKESNFIWNTDRYLKVLIGNTVDRRSLGVRFAPFTPTWNMKCVNFATEGRLQSWHISYSVDKKSMIPAL